MRPEDQQLIPPKERRGGGAAAERRALEALIDEIAAQSFPASDPPAWGAAAARLEALGNHPDDRD